MGMVDGPTNSIILERAMGGSLDDYLRQKCSDLANQRDEDDTPDIKPDDQSALELASEICSLDVQEELQSNGGFSQVYFNNSG